MKPTSKRLAKVVIEKGKEGKHARSFLLPDRFRAYLDDVYFANYEPGSPTPISRHSVAHGEATAEAFSLKASTIGFLTLYQIALFLAPQKPLK
jgi:hypothetical protein